MEPAERSQGTHPRYQFGPFIIDIGERVLRRDGHPVALTPKAFDLLAALLERPGRLFSKDELLERVWPGTFVEEANLAYNVFALRKALGDTPENSRFIETVPRRGYRFTAAVARADPEITILRFRQPPAPSDRAAERAPDLSDASVATSSPPGPARPLRFTTPRWVWLVVGSALVAAGSFGALRQRASTDAEPPRMLPLTSLPGVVRSPSLSPDGSYVVFTWNGPKRDNPDLYLQQIGVSAPPLRLTSDPDNDHSASWSPDGRTIAFVRRRAVGSKNEVWRIAPFGGLEQKVTDIQPRLALFRPASIGWCPDSTCLLVTDTTGPGKPDAVFVVPLETGGKRQLTHPEGLAMDADPSVSPDGRSLVFRRDPTPFSGQFFRLALNGRMESEGPPIQLTPILYAGKPAWTPDSREILFSDRRGLWRLDTSNGSTPQRLPFIGQDGTTPVVSRAANGRRRLVYVRSFADMNVWRVDTLQGAQGASQPAVAIASIRSDALASLAPDGRRVVFLSDRSGEFEFWVSDLDGSNADQLTSMSILPGFAKWSADGTLIAFHGDPAGRPDVLVVPARGGEPRVITAGISGGAFPSFSRDGQWIYFAAGLDQGESRIWKMPVAGGAPVQVTNNTSAIAIESYEGDLYYVDFVDKPGSVWRLPKGGGAPAKVVDGVVLGNFDVVRAGLYYIHRVVREPGTLLSGKPDGETQLRYFDFSTARSSTVAENLGSIGFGLTASADGSTVLFSRVDSSVDELVMVEDFK